MTKPFQKIRYWAEAERLNSSKKAKRLQTAEAKRNRVNILSTRDLACCNTSTNRTANVIQLANGIVAHKFTGGSSLPWDESQGLDTLGSIMTYKRHPVNTIRHRPRQNIPVRPLD
jgi:hypothetical protein